MKAPTRGQRDKSIGLLLMLSFVLMITLAAAGFVLSLKETVDRRTNYMIDDAVQQYSKAFAAAIDAKLTATVTVADILSSFEDSDLQRFYSIADKVALRESFNVVALSDINGDTILNSGSKMNMSEKAYFKQALGGETVITYDKKSPADKEGTLIIAAPVYNAGAVDGVLTCGYELSKLEQLTEASSYFGEAYMTVYSGGYRVISWQQHRNALSGGSDLVQILMDSTMLGGMSVDRLRSNMDKRMSGSFSMEYLGENRLVGYTPLGINDWYVFCYSPFTVYNKETAEMGRIVLTLLAELAVAITFLAYYILRTNRRHSKVVGAANLKYEAIISNICGGVQVTTFVKRFEDMEIIYVSAGFTEMTGYTLEDIISRWNGKIYHYVCEKDIEAINRSLAAIADSDREYDMEYRIVCSDGRIVWVMDRGKIIENEEGIRQFQSVLTDISVIKEQRDMLAISEERFRIAIESADNMMFDYDSVNGMYVDFANAERMLGKSKDRINRDLEYMRCMSVMERIPEIGRYFYHPDDLDKIMEQSLIGMEQGEVYFDARVRIAAGGYIWCRIHLTFINDTDGSPYRVLGFMGNIDAVKRQAELFRVRSEKDALTGFYNKEATISLVNDALCNDVDTPHTMFVMDIDNFKTINDTMGHIAGDAVIAEVAERVRAIFRSDDILGRVGGDEFIVLIRGIADVDHIIRKATEVTQAFHTMSVNAGGFFSVSVSIGIEVCTDRSNYEEIFIRADKALYQAKRSGKNRYVFFNNSLNNSSCYTRNNVGGTQVKCTR